MVRRGGLVRVRIARSLIAAIGAAVVATLPLGSSSALAAGSNHVSASTLLSDACAATFAASAFRGQGHVTEANEAISIDFYFGSAGNLLTFTQHGNQTVSLITNGNSAYLKGNEPFWQSQTNNAGAASLLAGRWIDMTSDKKDVAGITKEFNKKSLRSQSQCGQGSSTAYVGNAAVNGVKSIKIHQASRHASDTYYVETGSTPYILRITGSPSQKNYGDLRFSDYGVQPDTSAPPGAIPISKFK